MKKPIANIGILLVLIIVLPPLFFTTYEVGNYYRNEQLIDSIYTSQLESVIFSLNQYSDDILSGWARQLERDLQDGQRTDSTILESFMENRSSVRMVFVSDSARSLLIQRGKTSEDGGLMDAGIFQDYLDENQPLVGRLEQYLTQGYRKMQPVDLEGSKDGMILFAFSRSGKNTGIAGLYFDPELFISENLGPKIQAVAQDKFYLSVFSKEEDAEIYSSEFYEVAEKNIEHKKTLWILPDYELGIELKGDTIDNLVSQRMWTSIWMILIVDAILIVAAIFIYRAIRQQMKLAQLKSEFVSNVSHEIRTPLAVINMYSETLEMDRVKTEAKKKEYYRIIQTETRRLSGIVNKILNFSRIESGKRDYSFQQTDINELINEIITNFEHHFKDKEVNYEFRPGKNLPPVSIDSEAVTDAIINLIDNGIKYSLQEKEITIYTEFTMNELRVAVKDNGVGIEEKHQRMVFDKFYRVTKGDLAHQAKGSGIGLSIVKHIMEAHGGDVSVSSTPGKGSVFMLHFPVRNKNNR
jgi:two-component system phosphate regulon sensor histidine kinase PhoR